MDTEKITLYAKVSFPLLTMFTYDGDKDEGAAATASETQKVEGEGEKSE